MASIRSPDELNGIVKSIWPKIVIIRLVLILWDNGKVMLYFLLSSGLGLSIFLFWAWCGAQYIQLNNARFSHTVEPLTYWYDWLVIWPTLLLIFLLTAPIFVYEYTKFKIEKITSKGDQP